MRSTGKRTVDEPRCDKGYIADSETIIRASFSVGWRMANREQLRILKREGVDGWNQWRRDNPEIMPDLSEAFLARKVFRGADLRGVSLRGTDLGGTNLRRAVLQRTDLGYTNLGGVNLIETDLTGANLNGARATGADFSDSVMRFTSLGAVDLRNVKGLETVRHEGPSVIGIDTIYLSKGKIPEVFLRGAGVPENFIVYMKSLAGTPEAFEYYSSFISYSTKDQEFADLLHSQLQSKGARVWLATEDLKIGDRFRARIDEAIRMYDKLLLVLSQDSVKSPWVASEVEAAFEKEHNQKRTVLFPIRLDDAVMETDEAWAAEIRRTRHIGDFRKWKEHGKAEVRN